MWIVPQYHGLFFYSGASTSVNFAVKKANLPNLSEDAGISAPYFRSSRRSAPHNLFLDTKKAYAEAVKRGKSVTERVPRLQHGPRVRRDEQRCREPLHSVLSSQYRSVEHDCARVGSTCGRTTGACTAPPGARAPPPAPALPPPHLRVKTGLAEMLKGGVIMDVVNAEQAKIAEDAGAVAVMALERVPADIRATGGVARMADPTIVEAIVGAVTIPVMAKCRIGHFVEAQVLQSLGVDYIDESEVLTPADEEHHVNKWDFTVPFVCGCRNLGEALRRIAEGAAMIRTKGEAGTGNVVEAVRHMRTVTDEIAWLSGLRGEQLFAAAKDLQAPYELVKWVAENGKLPVVNFSAGGIATPADAALMMQLGCDGVFVGSGIFKSGDPAKRAKAIVEATTHFEDADIIARVSRNLGEAMVGINISDIPDGRAYAGAWLVA